MKIKFAHTIIGGRAINSTFAAWKINLEVYDASYATKLIMLGVNKHDEDLKSLGTQHETGHSALQFAMCISLD